MSAGRSLPPSQWAAALPDAAGAIGEAISTAEDGRVGRDGATLVTATEGALLCAPDWLAGLDSRSAQLLGLPPPTPLALDVRSVGRIDQDSFRVAVRWVRPGGQAPRVDIEGAIINAADGPRRIPEPMWSLYLAAKALDEPVPTQERFRLLSQLREQWPTRANTPVETDGYLDDLRVHYASSFSLRLGRLGAFDFDPVLFGPRKPVDQESTGSPLDEEADSLLSGASQRLFSEDRFRREPAGRPVYVLKDGEYVFVDPALRPVLDVVRRLQDRPEAERREFVLNPRRVLNESLASADAGPGLDLDELFVETEQFSQRVAGIDLWRAPVLPWLAPGSGNSWLPERFGLRVGEGYFLVPPQNVAPLVDRVEAAAASGAESVDVTGLLEPFGSGHPPAPERVAVNEQVAEAVRSLAPFAVSPGPSPDEGAMHPPPAAIGRMFLVVRENLDEVEFAPFIPEDKAPPLERVGPPGRLRTTLKPHQLDGLSWLVSAVRSGRPGALLADDMGLGKTVQAIAFMAWLQAEAEAGRRPKAPFLIVAPTGLLGNWRDEIDRHLDPPRLGPLLPAFGPDLKGLREADTLDARDIETGRAALKAERWQDAGVVLTTYETLRDYHFSFARTRFGLVVHDEVQKLKNPASQLTRAAKTINSVFTLGMTGTPVENRLQDLWSIMDVISPGLLGSSRDFERRHPPSDPGALKSLKGALMDVRDGRPPYMLRRMKSDVLEGLPKRHIHTLKLDMPPAQANAYRDLVVRAAAGMASGAIGKGGMLSTLAAMRGVSLHPVDPRAAPPDLVEYAKDSARLSETLNVLTGIAERGEKALIFVEDLAMQERLAGLIQARFGLPRPPRRINGGVPGPKRQESVREFQEAGPGFGVMILSPRAGGVGLTLTAANHVIHLSRWWNPAVEDQATDRVHRIGQQREVHVHLPLAVHPDPTIGPTSFDLRLDDLIERKRALTRDLFFPPEGDDDDLAQLFRQVALAEGQGEAPGHPLEPPAAAQESVAAGPVTIPVGGVRELSARIWRAPAGAPRPTDEVLALFEGMALAHVHIRDPYALARRPAREAQVALISRLAKVARRLDAVTVEYAPEVDGDLPEPAQRRAFSTDYLAAFPAETPRLTLARRPKRARDDDFHDRFVDLEVVDLDGAIRTHGLILGRGAEALFDQRKQCTVAFAPGGA